MVKKLKEGQDKALKELLAFINDDTTSFYSLCGYSGCGKTTLIDNFLKALPKVSKFYKDVLSMGATVDSKEKRKILHEAAAGSILLTATTHQASEVLSEVTGVFATTIHSALGVTLTQDYKTGEEYLKQKSKLVLSNMLIIIDEATMLNKQMLNIIKKSTHNCKIIFVMDPKQVLAVAQKGLPAKEASQGISYLTEPVRQDPNSPICVIGSNARDAIGDIKPFPGFPPESDTIKYIDSEKALESLLLKEYPKDYKLYENQIKYLCWTNAEAESINSFIRSQYTKERGLIKGEVVKANNLIIACDGSNQGLANSSISKIIDILGEETIEGVQGQLLNIKPYNGFFQNNKNSSNNSTPNTDYITVFRPYSYYEAKQTIKKLGKQGSIDGDFTRYFYAKNVFSDLRLQYASTVHKAQGSTFDKAIVNVGDILKCNNKEDVLRMLYVACTRPRFILYLYNVPK